MCLYGIVDNARLQWIAAPAQYYTQSDQLENVNFHLTKGVIKFILCFALAHFVLQKIISQESGHVGAAGILIVDFGDRRLRNASVRRIHLVYEG